MKHYARLTCVAAIAALLFASTAHARPGPFDGKEFKGRIAFSSDGNYNDEDDWGAFPVAVAILDGLGSKTLSQLGQIEAWGFDRDPGRIEGPHGQAWLRVKWPRGRLALADTPNRPIHRPRRLLDNEVVGYAFPGHRPAHPPAMARSYRAAILEVDAALRDPAIIEEHPRSPPLMALDASGAAKGAVKQHDGAGVSAPGRHVPDIVAIARTAVQQHLAGIRRELRRLGRSDVGYGAIDRHAL